MKDLFLAAYNLTTEQRKRTVQIALAIAGVILVAVIFSAGGTATTEASAEHPIWEVVILYRLALARMFLAVALIPAGALAAVTLYQTIENTDLGKRLLVWTSPENYEATGVMAAKTRNGGYLLASLLFACILGLLVGVLR